MLKKIADILKEVFWLKQRAPKPYRPRRSVKAAKRRVPATKKKSKLVIKTPVKKAVVKAKAALKAPKVKEVTIDPNLVLVGEITHYFDRIKVAVVKITSGSILIGDKLSILGVKTKIVQKVWSMQVESNDVKVGKKGESVGLKVDKLVVVGDKVYK